MNRLNLFKVLIVLSASFLQGCAICSSSSFSSSPSVITSVGCSENSETIYSTENARDWLVPSRKCTSRNVELNGSFFVRSFFCQTLPVLHTLSLRSLRYAFFLWSFWTQYKSNFLSCINLQNNQIWKQQKDLKTFELENSNMISSRFR